MAAHSLYSFAIMGKRTFTTLFKQLTIIFQPLTTWTAAPATGTGSVEAGLVEESHLSPSPPCVTPAYTTHAPFPTSMMCLDTETFNVPLQIPVGTDGAMVCHSSVCHMPLSLWLGGWREVTHGAFCHCSDRYSKSFVNKICPLTCLCLG